ncbi:hypothetical protein AMS68_006324 [Peltaster fructicola]|uniref:Probable beta-glucosidase E n=1 Tax=Peltaster fructicola TaxID=286661 RepID=A0A6H0Y1E8_9PEZI|nr:hypothetical protein AMS68_006324 [Peltaster fructicola]
MPIRAPHHFELEQDDTPRRQSYRDDDTQTEQSYASDISDLDPLQEHEQEHISTPLAPRRDKRQQKSWDIIRTPSRFQCALVALFTVSLVLLLGAGGLWTRRQQRQPVHTVNKPGDSEPWYPTPQGGTVRAWQESYSKAAELVKQMTLVEKINITTGIGWSMGMCVGNTAPVERLGFPSLCLQDGPLGIRFTDNATAFPAGITVGATWNKRLMYLRGQAHGFEARKKGINVLLSPAMGPIGRLPAGGRNWEGFGADPVLQGIAAAETIKGIQSNGVIATAKHWIGNEQEHFRQAREWPVTEAISSNIDDRTLHEIYAWPFAESVRAGVGSVMCSYNRVNNSGACQNSKLLNGILKDELGFQGFVQSDWLAQRSGVASALAGLDMSMPGDGLMWQDGVSLWGRELTKAVLNTSVPIERLNDMVLRVVAAWYQHGQDNKTIWPSDADGGGPNFSSWTRNDIGKLHFGSPDSEETGIVNKHVPVSVTEEGGNHEQLARRIASEGIVLVKNTNDLLPLQRNGGGIQARNGGKVRIGLFGEDGVLNSEGPNACEDRSCNKGTLAMGWGSGAVDLPYLVDPVSALQSAFDSNAVELTQIETNDDSNTAAIAAKQDLCMVFINSDAGEGYLSWNNVHGDRPDLYAQNGGDELVQSVATACGGDTIVVLHTVGPTILDKWIDLPGVKAVLVAHLPGQESGNALADVVFGYLNPSGHLPYTIAHSEDDYGPTSKVLTDADEPKPQQNFEEGLYIDYRYFDKHNIEPRYEFGYGLSYTTFKLSNVTVRPTGVNGTLPNEREYYAIKPPNLSHLLPDVKDAVLPNGFRLLQGYIYPYLDPADDVKRGQYQWPDGYEKWHAPSEAGGAQGGNPDLYTTVIKLAVDVSNTGKVAGDCVVQIYISLPDHVLDRDGEVVDTPVRVLRALKSHTRGHRKRQNQERQI